MFYKLIENKRNEWLASEDCTIKELLQYIEQRGMMRDAQLEAIKTYLFLKIACKNQPLWRLLRIQEPLPVYGRDWLIAQLQ